jgi:hypothetical protein
MLLLQSCGQVWQAFDHDEELELSFSASDKIEDANPKTDQVAILDD